MKAVFMIGEQRSGSNLLRCILNESPKIAAPHPPHILQRMMPLMSLYHDLNDDKEFDQLVDDVCRLIEANPVKWDKVTLNRDEVKLRCKARSLVAVYGSVMDLYAESHEAESWLCKSMQNVRWSDQLNEYFEKPKYIYLYRDPRDVTVSFMKAVIGDKHPYFIAKQWTELQQLCIQLYEKLSDESVFRIQYESFIAKPNDELQRLCDFLEISYSNTMLNSFHKSSEANHTASSSQLWENLTQPIITSNTKKYLDKLSPEYIKIVESISGPVMDKLGYERMLIQAGQEEFYNDEQISEFDHINNQLKNKTQRHIDPEDLIRRQCQAKVIEEIQRKAS